MFDEFEEKGSDSPTVRFYLFVVGGSIAFMLIALIGLNFAGVISFSSFKSGNAAPAKAGVSSKNKEHARAALNAIGEINSVASVGANYMQYTGAVQSAKIKFDAALRDFESPTPEEQALMNDLEEAFECYVDAATAWSEFIQDGDRYGFLKPPAYSKLHEMSAKYNFRSDKGEFFKDTVVGSILRAGTLSFNDVSQAIK